MVFTTVTPDQLWQIVLALLGSIVAVIIFIVVQINKRREYRAGQLRGEVIVVTNILKEEDGKVVLLPRTVVETRSLQTVFVNDALVAEIIAATKKSRPDDLDSLFIILDDILRHKGFMKRVVGEVSQLAAEGHAWRAAGLPVIENDMYVVATFADDDGVRRCRIDFMHGDTLKLFLNPSLKDRLDYRKVEGSHDDMAAIFFQAAQDIFGEHGDRFGTKRVKRVSFPIPDHAALMARQFGMSVEQLGVALKKLAA